MNEMKYQNLFNLTELWKIGGLLTGKFISEDGVFASFGTEGDWPNKLWIKGSLNSQKLLAVPSLSKRKPFSLAIWEDENKDDLLGEFGFHPTSELVGMSCDLASFSFRSDSPIKLHLAKTPEQASFWSRGFFEAFGYEIPPITVLALGEK